MRAVHRDASRRITVQRITCVVLDPSQSSLLSRRLARSSVATLSDVECSGPGKWSLKLVWHCGGSVTSHLHREILRHDSTLRPNSGRSLRCRESRSESSSLSGVDERTEKGEGEECTYTLLKAILLIQEIPFVYLAIYLCNLQQSQQILEHDTEINHFNFELKYIFC